MRLSRPFIRLPWRFDAAQLAAEALALPSTAWMPHPNGTAGNSAVALISSGGGDNDSFEGEKRATPHLAACQYMRQVMASFGVVLSRSRLMKLDAGAEVGLHVDFNYHWFSRVRIHIPVLTHPSVIFHCGAERLHMGAGECWLFDSWRRHNVVNPAPRERIHLVIDTAGSSSFWEMARSAAASDAEAVAAAAQLVPFDRAAHPKLNVERYSAPPVMAPGECAALVEDLIADFESNPTNDAPLRVAYARLLRGFVEDWRELWHLHGPTADGMPHFRALIGKTRRQLHPNRRALTTASNDIGVNAVFTARVLNAALAPESQPSTD